MDFKGTGKDWIIKGNYKYMEVYSKEYNVPICALARQSSFESDIDSQQQANAKLISKAPELLELLNQFINISDELNVPYHLIETFANLYANAFNTIQEATTI